MSAQAPGADQDTEAMWSPALARGLIRHDALRSIQCCDGYTDLLGPTAPDRRRRPIMNAALRMHGIDIAAERERAAAALHLEGERRVLDVACGDGDSTRFFARRLAGDGFVIGFDSSLPMIERAAGDNTHARAVYMRGDALSLPFDDGAFDAVCCLAALHLVPEPFGVLREMVRVLAPRGRIAVMTSYGREPLLVRKALEVGATICGVRVFDRTTIPAFLAAAGLIDINQHLRGITQLVTARRPAQPSDRGRNGH
jgi:SAM-dependent methyltransferase